METESLRAGEHGWAFLRATLFQHLILGLLEPWVCRSTPPQSPPAPPPGRPRFAPTAPFRPLNLSRLRPAAPAPGAPPTAQTRAHRLRDAAPDRMSVADCPGQNSSPEAEAEGQDATPSSRHTTPSAAMAPGGHALPAAAPRPGSAHLRVLCSHGNAASARAWRNAKGS